VGEERTRAVDVRILAATNRELKGEVEAGRFREDLYYRLNVFPVEVPPLRKRKDDIPLLAVHFLEQAVRRLKVPVPRFTEAQVKLLQSYDWPGNVRELQNATERALILARDGALHFDLPDAEEARPPAAPPVRPDGAPAHVLTENELRLRQRENLLAALARADWKVHGKGGAAELLGLRPTTLVSRMKKLKLRRPEPAREPDGAQSGPM
jgi:transcriptional regulator with GAF, ATPase, and Fis domain